VALFASKDKPTLLKIFDMLCLKLKRLGTDSKDISFTENKSAIFLGEDYI
jgi:hypothetical protein